MLSQAGIDEETVNRMTAVYADIGILLISNHRNLTSAGEATDEIPLKFGGISKREVHNRRVAACMPLCAPAWTQPTRAPSINRSDFSGVFSPCTEAAKGKQEKVLPLL